MYELQKVFNRSNDKVPIWLMRQAGRYLPEYLKIRESCDGFLDLCFSPEKAAEVTMQPIKRFDFDAAILFADILTLPYALGWDVTFKKGEGPILKKFSNEEDLKFLQSRKLFPNIKNIYETVERVRNQLPSNKSLIGFAGSPWTVMSYMLEGRGKQDFSVSKGLLYTKTKLMKDLLEIIIEQTIIYLKGQIKAGVDIIQLFDSWSGMLQGKWYDDFVINPTKKIVDAIRKEHPEIKIIGFPKGSGLKYKSYIKETGIDGVGIDQFYPVDGIKGLQSDCIVQGNLDPVILLSNKEIIASEVDNIFKSVDKKGFIFNLGHGILPSTPIKNVEFLVNYVRSK